MLTLIRRSNELHYLNILSNNEMQLLINCCNLNERRKDKVLNDENHFCENLWESNIPRLLSNFQKHGILQTPMVIEQHENRFKSTEIHSVQIRLNSRTPLIKTKLKCHKT